MDASTHSQRQLHHFTETKKYRIIDVACCPVGLFFCMITSAVTWLPCKKICHSDFGGKSRNIPRKALTSHCAITYHVFGPFKIALKGTQTIMRSGPPLKNGSAPSPWGSLLKVFTISRTTRTPFSIYAATMSSHYVPRVSFFIMYTQHNDTIKPFVNQTAISFSFGLPIYIINKL